MQIAKLFLRGKLMNKTAKNLTLDQVKEVEKYCNLVWADPELAHTKTVFCSKLSWMIPSAYQDLEAAMQEVWVVYWKTTVDILFHRPKQEMINLIQATCAKCNTIKTINCTQCNATKIGEDGKKCLSCYGRGFLKTNPTAVCQCGASATLVLSEDLFSISYDEAKECYTRITGKAAPERDLSILTNPIQRRKFYKTTLWTYLKQIVNENKPRTHKISTTIKEYAEKAACIVLSEIIGESCKEVPKSLMKPVLQEKIEVEFNTNLISLEGIMKIKNLQDVMIGHNVEITLEQNKIIVKKIGKTNIVNATVKKTARVNYLNIFQPEEDSPSSIYLYPNAFIEVVAPPTTPSEMEQIDGLLAVRKSLDEMSRKVFDLIISPPTEYSEKYSVNPVRRSNVCRFLNISKSEVDAVWDRIQKAAVKAGLHY